MRGATTTLAAVTAVAAMLLALAGPVTGAAPDQSVPDQSELAQSGEDLSLVHRERIDADPYTVTVGFTEWPLFDERSLDIVFRPEPGVDQVSGTLTLISPTGQESTQDLVRHPKMRDAYGLDIFAFYGEGPWTLRLDLQGPDGPGIGTLDLPIGPRPGPPILIGWIPTWLVLGLIVSGVVLAWRRYRPGLAPQARTWNP